MRLTTKGRFAVTAMIDLALRQNTGPVTLAAISQRQQISLSYLEQLFGKLRRHELVESTRGPGGGYSARAQGGRHHRGRHHRVGRRADRRHPVRRQGKLPRRSRPLHDARAVGALNQRMVEFLDSVTLQKLVDDQIAKGVQIENKPAVKRAISASRSSSRSA
jgi:Rrf2 family iron-sulfur cluster assembly transcriptional regulator